MSFKTHAEHISFCYEPENIFWSEEFDGDHYSENGVVDNNCGEVKQRNDTIEKIREKYTKEKKPRNDYYEKHAQRTYKSKEHYRKFLQEIEEKQLDLKLECKQTYEDRLDYLFVDDQKVGRNPVTKQDPDIHYSFGDLDKCEKEEHED